MKRTLDDDTLLQTVLHHVSYSYRRQCHRCWRGLVVFQTSVCMYSQRTDAMWQRYILFWNLWTMYEQ